MLLIRHIADAAESESLADRAGRESHSLKRGGLGRAVRGGYLADLPWRRAAAEWLLVGALLMVIGTLLLVVAGTIHTLGDRSGLTACGDQRTRAGSRSGARANSAMPSAKRVCARKPRSRAAPSGEATMCLTSPRR